MAAKNEVTLTFAGDTDKLERAFERVGSSAQQMERKVDDASSGFDRAYDTADSAENKFQGVASTLEGTTQAAQGFSQIASGDLYGGLVTAGGGLADLAEGFAYTVIPLAQATAGLIANKAAALGHAIASGVARAATVAWTGVQWALNAALTANPIGLVILAIVALVAAVVIAYKKSDTFRAIVQAAFRGVAAAGRAMWEGLKTAFSAIGRVAESLWSGLKRVFRLGVDAIKGYASAVTAPYRIAFAGIKAAWNATVGGRGFDVPGWVPGVGGKSFRIPTFHTGGTVPGAPGSEMLAILQAGERVTPAGQAGAPMVLEIRSGGSRMDDLLVEVLRRAVRSKGGDVQVVLGS